MSQFLSQMHLIEERNEQISSLNGEYNNDSIPTVTKIDTQTLDYIREVYTIAGKILYYISASNWTSYYQKIKNAVNILSAVGENTDVNPPEVRILAFASLNISKLHTILTELSPYFLNMKIQRKLLFAKMMRMAIWRWIEMKPFQFAEICQSKKRPLAGSEILFDMCNAAADSSYKKAILWPLQTILLSLSPDLLVQAFLDDRGLQNRRTSFSRQLKLAMQTARTQEVAAICYVDLCKAATYVSPTVDSMLRHIAADNDNILREKLWDFGRSLNVDAFSFNSGYTTHQGLVTDYFLSRLKLDSEKTLKTTVPSLLEEDTPTVFKQAFVNACLIIDQEEKTLPWNPTISSLCNSISGPLRRIFIQTVKLELINPICRSDISSITLGSKKTSGSDRASKTQCTTALLQSILKLFKLNPLTALMGEEDTDRVEENAAIMVSMVNLLRHHEQRIRRCAMDCLIELHDSKFIRCWGPVESKISNFWKISFETVSSIARQILDTRQHEIVLKALLELLSKIMISRISFLNEINNINGKIIDNSERQQTYINLEVALLVSLCSPVPEICSAATRCLGYMCKESKLVEDEYLDSSDTPIYMSFNYNIEIYEDLAYEEPAGQGVRKQPFIGRKAQQKRVRKYLRMMTTPSPGNVHAWDDVWRRWKKLIPMVTMTNTDSLRDSADILTLVSTGSSSVPKKIGGLVKHDKSKPVISKPTLLPLYSRLETDDEKQTEWQNFTGFLAALGGSRLVEELGDDTSSTEDSFRKYKNSERAISPSKPLIVDKFICDMVDLLTCDNVFVREAVKDTLGGDLSPPLYSILFRNLELLMGNCFSANGEVVIDNVNTLFVEQAVLILKMILDRLTDPGDSILTIDFSTLIVQFATYINRLNHENYTTMRTMIMMCHLTEVLMSKKEQVIIRDDVKVRNKLLQVIIEWTSDFNLRVTNNFTVLTSSQNGEVQRDLDQVCLKAIVSLLHKLPLQSLEQIRDVDRVNTRDMQGLAAKSLDSHQYWGPLKEAAINALSNLLSANVDSGLKGALAMGYHEDVRTRAAFLQVLTNILNQGAQFDTLAESIVFDRYEKLVDILVESDIEISLALCDSCAANGSGGIAKVLINCFESRNKIMTLLKAVIEREVNSTEQEATLFRGTTMSTRILSIYARDTCVEYVRATLQPALEKINRLPEEDLTWELDPQKISSDETALKNKQNVCQTTEFLLDAICNSAEHAPMQFRQQLSIIVVEVSKRFPDALKTAVGGFVFLRLFNPAILTPEANGFPKQALPRSKNIRKILLQATRMMQNLANDTMFGAKETHLISLNDFITANVYRVSSFLRDISTSAFSADPHVDSSMVIRMEHTSYVNLHRYLADNLEKIQRDLSLRRSRSSNDTQRLLEWKRTMDKFSNLLAQLGSPNEVVQHELNTIRNYALVNSNNYYSEFMRRNKHRDLSPIITLNGFYQGGVSRAGRPVFYLISRHIVGPNLDYELLMYYILRVLEPSLNRPFEFLLDLTRLSEDCEIPVQWLTQLFQLIFNELDEQLTIIHLFNPNFHFQRYIRSLPRIMANKIIKRCRFSINFSELSVHISPSEIKLPKGTLDIEKEMGMCITNAFLVSTFKTMIPVQIKIGAEYFQVTTIREQEIFWSLNAVFNDVFSMDDLTEIFLPSSPPNKKQASDGEIHIVHAAGKSTMVLVVPNREEVYKYLIDRKKNFDSNITDENHGIRPTDVPGRILNIALLNITSDDPALRLKAYNLLFSLCLSFRFGVGNQLINARDLCIPFNNVDFVVSMSESLAATETHLTLEFLSECILGFNRTPASASRQITILEYMIPWLKNLTLFIHQSRGKEPTKVKEVLLSIIILTAEKAKCYPHIQKTIWKTLGGIEELHNILLDNMIQYSVEKGIGSPEAEAMADTIVTMNSHSISGKVIHKMRKVLQSTAQDCRLSLIQHHTWCEIGCLTRFLLMLSFYIGYNIKHYVAEVFHITALILSTGPTFIRSSVHELVVNNIHSLVTNKAILPENRKRLKYVLDDVCDGKYRVHFGLNKSYANAFTITEETMTDHVENMNLSSLEVIVRLMLDALNYAAPNSDCANTWRARWMSLVTSMTFRFNPALQPRAFVILGCLAQDEIDDDLLFQILVVLGNELTRFDESNPNLVISILMCLTNIIDNLSPNSRYLKPLFWLAVLMIQMNHAMIFTYAVKLLHAVLRTLDNHNYFQDRSIEDLLMETRESFASIPQEIDKATGLSFDQQFSFAITGSLMKGFRYADARETIFSCLSSFLEIESKNGTVPNMIDSKSLGYLCGLLPFSAKNDTLVELLRLGGITDIDLENLSSPSEMYAVIWKCIDIPNNSIGILLVSFLVGMLSLTENETERLFLYGFLSRAAVSTPEVFALVYDSLIPKMNAIMVSSDNVTLMDSVKDILLTACFEPAFNLGERVTHQQVYLESIGFSALVEMNFGLMNTTSGVNAKLASELLHLICE
ncbi:hypothetical protein BDB01DRAFT_714840 [Pilobolus umbonatus]|nr:hypothetical protein BDB01DRAFT_714840 [Pilobolus umbonatus]